MNLNEELSIRLRVPAEWSGIEPVREAVGKVLHVVCLDRDLEDAVSMVCAELLDNALRYGRHDGGRGISFSLQILEGQLVVSVSHAVAFGSPDVPRLLDRLAWVTQKEDPAQAFVEALGQVGARAPDAPGDGGVGVGLARVAYMGGCRLACDTSTRDRITVIATRALAGSDEDDEAA
jgi:anti-sigma regulatory factor (Ser/Thr protein kinase)